MDWHCYANAFSIIYLSMIYFAYAIITWGAIFNYYISLLFASTWAAAVFGTVIVALQVYMHHYNHIYLTLKLKF